MKKQLFITNALLSLLGVFSLLFAFVRAFDGNDEYSLAAMALIIVLICILSSATIVFIKKAWIVFLIYGVMSIVFAGIFRYELVGGYMEFFNRIADGYSKYFHAEMYFAEMTKKLKIMADTVMVMYFTMIFVSFVFPVLIFYRKPAILAGITSIFFMTVAVVIEKVDGIMPCVLSIIFFIETIIISGAAKFELKAINNNFYLQLVSVVLGIVIILTCGVATSIVPKEGYVKSKYFDAMGDAAVRFYSNMEEKITSLVGKLSGEGSSKETGKKIIEDNHLDALGDIEYKNEELIRVNVSKLAGIVKLKQYIGQTYENNTWREPDLEAYSEYISKTGNDYQAQTITSSILNYIALTDRDNTDFYKSFFSVEYTNLQKNRQLAPIYPLVVNDRYFEGDGYYKFFDNDEYVAFYNFSGNVSNLYRLNLVKNLRNMDSEWEKAEKNYRDYVYENYLDCDEKYIKLFGNLGEKYGINSIENILNSADYFRQYLANKCTYTLTPGKLPKGKDFIEYFYNENKKGYCVHFATTAVMMFRANGIPARYVSGFSFASNASSYINETFVYNGALMNNISVLDSNAHAWIEFYLDGIGWVEFDVTPGNFERIDLPDEEETTTVEDETTTESKTSTEKESTSTKEEKSTETTSNNTNKNEGGYKLSLKAKKIIAFVAGVIGVIVFFISYILFRYRVKITKYKLDYDNYKLSDKEKCIQLKYNEFQCILKFVNILKSVGMSYQDFSKYIIENCNYFESEVLGKFIEICEKSGFSDENITDDELQEVEKIVNELNEKVYSDLNFLKRISFKYLKVLR